MRAVDFIYTILDKYAPMNEVDRAALRRDAQTWYVTNVEKHTNEQTDSMWKKIFNILEHWGFRTFLAVAYIYIMPQIQDYMDGGSNDEDDDDDNL